jgi:hypothetical protein
MEALDEPKAPRARNGSDIFPFLVSFQDLDRRSRQFPNVLYCPRIISLQNSRHPRACPVGANGRKLSTAQRPHLEPDESEGSESLHFTRSSGSCAGVSPSSHRPLAPPRQARGWPIPQNNGMTPCQQGISFVTFSVLGHRRNRMQTSMAHTTRIMMTRSDVPSGCPESILRRNQPLWHLARGLLIRSRACCAYDPIQEQYVNRNVTKRRR